MRASEPPRRCKCDECAGTHSVLHEFDLFSARKPDGEEKEEMAIVQ